MSVEQIEKEALALPSDDRARLADRLVESLDATETSEIDKLWAVEAQRRLEEIRQGRVKTLPGDEVLDRVRRRHAGGR